MKIGLITGEYPPMQGGVGDYTHELAKAYVELGHEVFVLTSVEGTGEYLYEDTTSADQAIAVRPVVRKWNLGGCRDILEIIRAEKPDVVNIQYQAAAYGMRLAIHLLPLRLRWLKERPKVVTTYHDLRVPYLFPKAGPLRWQAVLALARWSDGVIVTNADDEAILAAYDFVPCLARVPIGSNIAPTPPPGYDRAAWRAKLGVQAGDVLLAYFGFLNESKGGENLIRALGHLAGRGLPVKLIMIGGQVGSSDPSNLRYAEHIQGLIDELGLQERVLSTGFVPEPEVSASLLASDICVLPYRDGVSLRRGTFMAALAHGLPIVSTRYPVAKAHIPNPAEHWHPSELRGGSNILLVPPDDEALLADAISRLIASPRLREHLGQEARALSGRFSWPQIARQTLELFHEIGASPDAAQA